MKNHLPVELTIILGTGFKKEKFHSEPPTGTRSHSLT